MMKVKTQVELDKDEIKEAIVQYLENKGYKMQDNCEIVFNLGEHQYYRGYTVTLATGSMTLKENDMKIDNNLEIGLDNESESDWKI